MSTEPYHCYGRAATDAVSTRYQKTKTWARQIVQLARRLIHFAINSGHDDLRKSFAERIWHRFQWYNLPGHLSKKSGTRKL